MGTTTIRGDLVVENMGWRYSGYGNGNVKSTLTADEEAQCAALLGQLDGGFDAYVQCR
jgi:hypothetical protein